MSALGSPRVTLPPDVAARMWHTTNEPQRVNGITFLEFMTADELDVPRPKEDGLDDGPESTAIKYNARVRQVLREIGIDVTPGTNWWHEQPPWDKVYEWRNRPDKGGMARLETHRKALVWYGAYWGQTEEDLPRFMRKSWSTKKRVQRAMEEGTMKKRNRFLRLPDDIATLLSSRPFTDNLKLTKQWKDDKQRAENAYLDDLFHVAVGLGMYTGPRPQDYAVARLRDYQPERGGIVGWTQRKKQGEGRDAAVPEDFLWHAPGTIFPSMDWYLQRVRPRVRRVSDPEDAPIFLTPQGEPYKATTFAKFLRTGMRRVLGTRGTGPHGLRRACATWRRRHGWSVEDIAILLDDTVKVVENSYLDHAWLTKNRPTRPRLERPPVPMIRANGERTLATNGDPRKDRRDPESPLDGFIAPLGSSTTSRGKTTPRKAPRTSPFAPDADDSNGEESPPSFPLTLHPHDTMEAAS